MSDSPSPFTCSIGDVVIQGKEWKTKAQTSKGTVIWGHGLCQSMKDDDIHRLFPIDEAALQTFDLVRYDQRGHGTSTGHPNSDDYVWNNLGNDMATIAHPHQKKGKVVLGGASMGAASSLYAALQIHKTGVDVAGLILAIPPTAWSTRAAQCAAYKTRIDFFQNGTRDQLVDKVRNAPKKSAIFNALTPQALDAWHGIEFLQTSPIAEHVHLGAAKSDFPPEADLLVLSNVPVLILAWEGDSVHPPSTVDKLTQLLPLSRVATAATLTDVQHEWPKAVAEFLESL